MLAEARLVAGDHLGCLTALAGLPTELRSSRAALLVEARAREGTGEIVRAFELYRQRPGPGDEPAAASRARSLEPRAVELVTARIEDGLARSRLDEAQRDLALLEAWRPRTRETIELRRQVAVAAGDLPGELASLAELAAFGDPPPADILRRAELELVVGNPELALTLLEELGAQHPRDPEVGQAIERARFRWRLSHSPEQVQRAAQRPELARADLARLLYWLMPGVRGARGGVARIASDVVGHPAQEEIVRLVNLGVMRVDETLHRFAPDRPVRRGEALEAVFRAAALDSGGPVCAAEALAGGWGRERLCAAAAACAWISEVDACLPGAPISGAEALEWIRRATATGEPRP